MSLSDLRIGRIRRRKPVDVRVNGASVTAFEGELLHGVLVAGGFQQLRKSVSGKEGRGFFCGMGVCCECLVIIDGRPRRQARVMEVYDGMRVEIDAG